MLGAFNPTGTVGVPDDCQMLAAIGPTAGFAKALDRRGGVLGLVFGEALIAKGFICLAIHASHAARMEFGVCGNTLG